jgi:hypothetical protein
MFACLVLDANASLNDTQIYQIRTAVSSFIDALRSRALFCAGAAGGIDMLDTEKRGRR